MHLGKKRSLYGRLLYAVLVFIPVVLWLGKTGLAAQTQSAATIVKAFGKTCALAGITMYFLQPVLSMRFMVIEKLFGGLDAVYHLHKQAGKWAFYLICAHPVLLGGYVLLGGKMWIWRSPLIVVGTVALAGFVAVTAATLYAHLKHQRWIVVHRLFGWLLPLMVLHTLLASAQVTHIIPLFIYMLLLAEIGFVSFLSRSVVGIFLRRYRYIVVEVRKVTPTVTELILKPTGVPIDYTPGQFAYLSLKSAETDPEPHPFSFTTANNGPYIRFAIKNLGDDTAKIKNITPGTPAVLEGPHGSFSLYNSKNNVQVWIAGGVGITPFLSMARSLRPGDKHKIHLFYGADKLDDAVFMRELIEIRKTIPDNFDFTLVNRQWSGFVSVDVVTKIIDNFAAADYFICGPPPMMGTLKKGLASKGVKPDHIFTEEFSVL